MEYRALLGFVDGFAGKQRFQILGKLGLPCQLNQCGENFVVDSVFGKVQQQILESKAIAVKASRLGKQFGNLKVFVLGRKALQFAPSGCLSWI